MQTEERKNAVNMISFMSLYAWLTSAIYLMLLFIPGEGERTVTGLDKCESFGAKRMTSAAGRKPKPLMSTSRSDTCNLTQIWTGVFFLDRFVPPDRANS